MKQAKTEGKFEDTEKRRNVLKGDVLKDRRGDTSKRIEPMSKTTLICLYCSLFIEQNLRLTQGNFVSNSKEHLEDQSLTISTAHLSLNMHLHSKMFSPNLVHMHALFSGSLWTLRIPV